MTISDEEMRATLAVAREYVQAGLFRVEVHAGRGFPGDALRPTERGAS